MLHSASRSRIRPRQPARSAASSAPVAVADSGKRAHHEHARGRERDDLLSDQMTESALHTIASDGVAHGLAHHEAHLDTDVLSAVLRGALAPVHDEGTGAGAPAGPDGTAKGLT